MYSTELATPNELENWNQIIAKCSYSEALHTIEWRNALTSSFKQLKPLYFTVRDNHNNLVGALSCFSFNPIPLSRSLLSMPWALPGGLLSFNDENIDDISNSIFKKLDNIAKEESICETIFTLPTRCNKAIADALISNGYLQQAHSFTHVLEIDTGYQNVWESYNKRVRGAVRKAEKSGVIVRETTSEEDMIRFYKMYLAMMSRFGSTPKPFSLLRYLQTSSIAKLVIAELDGSFIAGLLFLHFNSYARLWCETSDPEFLNYRPNNAIIDYIVKWSCEKGYHFVDFGASPIDNEGLVAFKEEWGAKKAWFKTFTKIHSPLRKKLWTVSEPHIRRIYAAIQHIRL